MNKDALRPNNLSEFIGQEAIKTQLRTVIQAAKELGRPVGHILLYGPAGTGKTSLAHIVAAEMGVPCWATTGTNLAVQLNDYNSLYSMGTAIEQRGILFCDEIHRVANLAQDTLLPFLEERKLVVKYHAPEAGAGWRKGDWITLNCIMKPFTFIGATTRLGLLQDPFRERFKLVLRTDFYDDESMYQIARRSAMLLELVISETSLKIVSQRSKGVPRLLNNCLWYAQQWQIAHNQCIDTKETEAILTELGIDSLGLNEIDRKLLAYLVELDRPAGINTIAAYLAEDSGTVAEVIEPPLIRAGLLIRHPRGRIASEKAKQHLKIRSLEF